MRKFSFVLISLLSLLLVGCGGVNGTARGVGNGGPGGGEKGEAVFTVSDAAADMGAVSDIALTIEGLRVRNEAGAWVEVDVHNQIFMLLDLRDRAASELLAAVELDAGTYDRLEVHVAKAVVIDAEGEHEAKIPSNTLRLEGVMRVEADATATADFDFLADQSLHVTGDGRYVFAPVVLLETRSAADVTVAPNGEVTVGGGNVSTRVELGVDVHGNVDAGLRITPDAVLSLSADGVLVQTGGQALASGAIVAVDLDQGTVTIETRNGAELVLFLAGDTEVEVNGEGRASSDLAAEVGTRINVAYDADTKAISYVAGGADAEARARVATNLSVSGVVLSVNTADGTVIVLTDAGTEVVLKAREGSRISLDGSVLSGLVGLESAIGSRIDARYDAGSGAIAAMKAGAEGGSEAQGAAQGTVQAEAQVTFTGTLEGVNALSGTITVANETGARMVFRVESATEVLVDGAVSSLVALSAKIGSQVSVTYDAETNIAGSVSTEASAAGSASLTGALGA